MKKLKLDLDELVVESFAVQEATQWTGTVAGNADREGERARPGFISWLFSCVTGCRNTCEDTCWDTCRLTCGETCNNGVSCDSGCEHVSFCHEYPTTESLAVRC